MKCGGCSKGVEEALKGMSGVTSVNVDLKHSEAKVSFDASRITLDMIKKKINELGYKTE